MMKYSSEAKNIRIGHHSLKSVSKMEVMNCGEDGKNITVKKLVIQANHAT